MATRMAQERSRFDMRRELAARCLGRLGTNAISAIPDLKRVTSSGGNLGLSAEIALALIARRDGTIQSNALASVVSNSQPHRHAFVTHADEIWPGRLDLFVNFLTDQDKSVQAQAIQLIGRQGPQATNCVSLLTSFLQDSSAMVRPRAALALGLVSPDSAPLAVACMMDQRKTNFQWTGDSAYVLYQSVGPGAKAAIPALEADLADKGMAMFHGDAAAALWRITGTVTPAITNGLNTGLRLGVQRTQLRCLRIIKEIGPPAAGTIPELKRLSGHPRILIRQLASEALESVEGKVQSSEAR